MGLTLILPQKVINEMEREKAEKMRAARDALVIQRNSVQTRQHYDESSDSLVIERFMDAAPTLDFAAEMRSAHPRNGYSVDRNLRHVAEVPITEWEKWLAMGNNPNDNVGWRRYIARPEFAKFRTVDKL
jgi:hypothetical protein